MLSKLYPFLVTRRNLSTLHPTCLLMELYPSFTKCYLNAIKSSDKEYISNYTLRSKIVKKRNNPQNNIIFI